MALNLPLPSPSVQSHTASHPSVPRAPYTAAKICALLSRSRKEPTFGAEAKQVDPGEPPASRVRQQRNRAAVCLPLAVLNRLPHMVQVPAMSH